MIASGMMGKMMMINRIHHLAHHAACDHANPVPSFNQTKLYYADLVKRLEIGSCVKAPGLHDRKWVHIE